MIEEKEIGPRIGAHKSIAKSIDLAIDRGVHSTCECLQIFTRPPRRWNTVELKPNAVQEFIKKSNAANYYDTAIHMPYLPNLASPDDTLFEKSVKVLIEEIEKMPILHVPYVITHLGSPKDLDEVFAAKRVAEALNRGLNHIKKSSMILLENSTAKRKKWGNEIEHIEAILSLVEEEHFIGVCFDTAHAFSSGYDISTSEGLNEVIDNLEGLVGKNKLQMFHINDSKGPLGSGIDHHEHIGKGYIGIECFRELMQNPRFKKFPMILETPKSDQIGDINNLELLRKFRSRS
ncbi:MAG: deoxyribonuclease IV [Candidatus Heimdallarchaeota archaeon]|nr:MAG: deoxyribonuclease IV [Candidatus Heimdallarchaeota archaeon]